MYVCLNCLYECVCACVCVLARLLAGLLAGVLFVLRTPCLMGPLR